MTGSLHPLFDEIATASTEELLRFRVMDRLNDYFGVQRWGITLLDTNQNVISFDERYF